MGVAGAGYNNNYRYHAAGSGSNKAQWTVTGLAPGRYQAFATWMPYSNRATNAVYTITDGSNPWTHGNSMGGNHGCPHAVSAHLTSLLLRRSLLFYWPPGETPRPQAKLTRPLIEKFPLSIAGNFPV